MDYNIEQVHKTGRLNPKLWEKAKEEAIKQMGKHSARAMQLAGKIYRELGGKYTDDLKPNQKSLKTWTAEDWGSDIMPYGLNGRYLPKKIREQLSEEDYIRTSISKIKGTLKGTQYVKQPADIVEKIKKIKKGGKQSKNYKIIDGYKYFISDKPNKKLMVNVNDKLIYFGAYPYSHFYDETELLDDKYNHYDIDRRYRYLKRSSKIKNKKGELTAYDPSSANYHAMRILWEF